MRSAFSITTVLGLDPGTATTGYGLVTETDTEAFRYRDSGVISTPSDMPHPERLEAIHTSVRTLVDQFSPGVAVVEEIYFSKNVKTAMSVGQARGVILLALQQAGDQLDDAMVVQEMNPSTVKKTLTGSGSADKKAMQRVVKQELGLSSSPDRDDAADALALAVSHLIKRRFQESIREQ